MSKNLVRFWMRDLWALLRYYKLRFALALMGVTLGFSAIVVLLIIQHSVNTQMNMRFQEYRTTGFVVHLVPQTPEEQKRIQRSFCYPEVNLFLNAIPRLSIYPIQRSFQEVFWQDKRLDLDLVLTHQALLRKFKISMDQGRTLHPLDSGQKILLMGQGLAQILRAKGFEPTTQKINLSGRYFDVVGVLPSLETNPLLDFDFNQSLIVDYSLARYLETGSFQTFFIQADLPMDEAQALLKQTLKEKYALSNVIIKDATVYMRVIYDQIYLTLNIIKGVAGLNIFLGLVGLINILCLLLEERRQEFGIRMSVGASNFQLVCMLVKESIALCLIGAVAGIAIGMPASYIIVDKLNIGFSLSGLDLLGLILLATLIGACVGLIPSLVFMRKNPIEFLR